MLITDVQRYQGMYEMAAYFFDGYSSQLFFKKFSAFNRKGFLLYHPDHERI